MIDDLELLRRYVEDRDEAAFAELVERHVNLVHSVALRQVNGDSPLAADITQLVFSALAKKAASLRHHRVLTGWLFTSTRFAAAKVVRGEQRRHAREQEAQLMEDYARDSGEKPDWDSVRPVLDDVLGKLSERDREAILLRFFESRDYTSVGAKLHVNDNTARMRVERALEKLRAQLERRGVTSTSAALAAVLAQQAVTAAPAGLAAAVTGGALAGGVAAGVLAGGASAGAMAAAVNFMSMTKLQLGITGALVTAGAVGLAIQVGTTSALQGEIAARQEQNRSLSALDAENQQLRRLQAEVADLRRDDAELVRLRDESQSLQAKLASTKAVRVAATKSGGSGDASTFTPGQLDRLPRPVAQPGPVYPAEMKGTRASGEVIVDFIVDPNGVVQNAYAIRSTHREFESAAVEAVKAWKFEPGVKGGGNVNTRLQVPIVFSLGGAKAGTPPPKSAEKTAVPPPGY